MIFSEYEHASINKSTVVYDLMFSLYTDQEILWSNLSVNILLANQVDGQFTLPTWRADSLENFRVMKRYENKEQKL